MEYMCRGMGKKNKEKEVSVGPYKSVDDSQLRSRRTDEHGRRTRSLLLLFFSFFLFSFLNFLLTLYFILGLASMSAVLPPLFDIGEGEGRLRVNANAKERTTGRRIIKSPHYTARREKPVLPRRQQLPQ